jgi:hypothetical protein
MPVNIRMAEDPTLLYIKTPQEMSRIELAELEKELRELNEPTDQNELTKLKEGEDVQDRTDLVKHLPEF